MPSVHAKSRRSFIFECLFDAVDATQTFRNKTMRTLKDLTKPPYAYPFIGSDTFEDFKRDESGRVQYGSYTGHTQCGVAFVFTDKADTKDDGKMIAAESQLIDAIESAILAMIGEQKTIPQSTDTGGYTIKIDYVQPTTNQVIQLDMGGKTLETSAVLMEVGWTQILTQG